ncbi:type II toxin-antitoxin system RelE/ParE family toxin [Altererythrobacter xixiisoli]|uniref:Toxin n=1 Tax=Croceibacterium xixiisoli TaxID=1476466 RepID=A0A6I4TYK3_9SPHN|nr:type II toxin-antitoxin system RelE/ParE family toxin [Croceibacterium xixiisoli]MXO99837.1 type II toxin-antitoxin system RelE/ParE family toxin [Croceibacterium xixiisoli]
MSSGIRVTPRATADLRNIGRYTLQRWGRDQRNSYLRALDARFSLLAKQPELGRRRDDVAPDYCSYRYEAHIIFYLIRDGGIDVIGVLHQAMDVPRHLGQP